MLPSGQLVEPAPRERADRGRRLQQLAQPPQRAALTIGLRRIRADPVHLGARLPHQRCRLAGALPAANDSDALAAPLVEGRVLATMADERAVDALERRRPPFLKREPHGDDDPTRMNRVAIFETQAEGALEALDPLDPASIEVRHRLRLEPFPVLHELLEWELLAPRERNAARKGV